MSYRTYAFRSLVFSAVLVALAACGPVDESPDAGNESAADLVLVGGKIITLDDDHPQVEALAAKDGKILFVGTRADAEALIGETTEVIDLGGALAIPGFNEGHGHFTSLGDFKSQLDLRFAKSWDEIVAQVEAAASEAEPGQWIRGRGWHQDKWDTVPEPNVEGFPLHASLSAVSPDNPVILTHASGHAGFANAKALELAGVDASTTPPQGGEILHDAAGAPTGLLRETAAGLVGRARAQAGPPSEAEKRRMVELASREALSKGITSFHDAGSPFETVDFLRKMADEGALGVRLWMMVRDSNERLAERLAQTKVKGHADHMFSVGGIKLSLDGALGSRGAWLLEPYSDSPGATGLNLITIEEAERTAEIALETGVQLCIHAIGDRANREVLDLFERSLEPHGENDMRWRVEHAQHLHPDDIPRFAELRVIASMQGVHCTSDGPWVPDRLGDKRTEEGAYMWKTLLDSGAVVTNGTDTPVEDVDPVASFWSTVTRQMPDGSVFYGDEKLDRVEALRTYTINVAYSAFEDHLKGTLEEGKLADITVLSKDILTVPDDEIRDAEVLYTIVGGKVAYRGE